MVKHTRNPYVVAAALFSVSFVMGWCGTALARALTGTLNLSTTVLSVLKVREATFPSVLTISNADIQAGVTSLEHAGNLTVYSNNRAGHRLQFNIVAPEVTSVEVIGLSAGPVTINAPIGMAYEPWVPNTGSEVPHQLSFKFHLAAGTQPGTINWPIEVSPLAN